MSARNPDGWVCSVCGYVHRGPRTPETCPVCGATADLFEAEKPAEPAGDRGTARAQWRCLNCEHVHAGPTPPAACPVCGAPAERFEAHAAEGGAAPGGGRKRKLVIVGAGIAGVSAAEAARKASPDSEILLLSKESDLPYYRLNLTRYLAGEIGAELLDLKPVSWYEEQQIDFRRGVELRGINPAGRTVETRDGARHPYDGLVLTAGAHPFLPPFPGANRENVTVLRTRGDADRILASCRSARCVCIGGGLLGLETAGALARRGVDVTLLEGSGWLLPRQINERAGRLLEARIGDLGIRLRRSARTRELPGDEQVRGVLLEDGVTLPADLVVIATGVRPNSYLARLAGLSVNQGVLVDDALRSSHPDVYAAGDVAEHRGVCYGTWGPAQFQGAIAGLNAAGGSAEFAGIPRSNMLKVLGIDLFSIGRVQPEDASTTLVDAESDGRYAGFLFRDSHLVGAILLGDTRASAAVKSAIEKRTDVSDLLRRRPSAGEVLDWLAAIR